MRFIIDRKNRRSFESPPADLLATVKKYQTRVRNLHFKSLISGQISRNVKKVPNGRRQGLDLGEIDFGNFPVRLKKSLR